MMKKMICTFMLLLSINMTGCGREQMELPETEKTQEIETEQEMTTISAATSETKEVIPKVTEIDLSHYFGSLNGCAVFYDQKTNQYKIYNEALADERRSPCSTHKIVTGLLGLEYGVIDKENSIRTWSGEQFWNKDWNQDIDFVNAFQKSCVWYFREIVNVLGEDKISEGLKKLEYGNCDISDWEGRLNTSNNNRVLTGYWIESSLLISPREQVEVLRRIFGEDSPYRAENMEYLKKAMITEQQGNKTIYGKTGLGKKDGAYVDAWFVGFAEDILYNEILQK